MIESIGDMPPGTLGFRAAGELQARELLDVLLPPLHDVVLAGGRLRLLVVAGPELAQVEPFGLWREVKGAVDGAIRRQDVWERTAVATDVAWLRSAVGLLSFRAPGELRVFGFDEEEPAKGWLLSPS